MADELEKFLAEIAPFTALWPSVELVIVAAKSKQQPWISLWGRITLSNELARSSPLIVRPTDSFFAYRAVLPFSDFAKLLQQIRSTMNLCGLPHLADRVVLCLPEDRDTGSLLFIHANGTFTWRPLYIASAENASGQFGIARETYSMTGTVNRYRIYDVFSTDDEVQVDSKLHVTDPPFEGLRDLYRELLPGTRFDRTSEPAIEILAPLPFQVRFADQEVRIDAPPIAESGDLKLAVFYVPGPERRQMTVADTQDATKR